VLIKLLYELPFVFSITQTQILFSLMPQVQQFMPESRTKHLPSLRSFIPSLAEAAFIVTEVIGS
jgi:hypothetical protein